MQQGNPRDVARTPKGRLDSNATPTVERTTKRLRVLVIAPSFDILGGQAVQAARLVSRLREEASLDVGFLPINPRLPGVLRSLQAAKYLRTIVTSIVYFATLLTRVFKYDVIHVFSASYFSFVLAPTPAVLVGKLYGKKVLLNYHSGEAEDHLTRWGRSALPTIRLVDEVAVPSEYLVRVFAKFGLKARAIYNIIETDRFRFHERVSLAPVFLSNRSLEVHYGVDRVLRALAIIQQRFPEASLTVVGDGSQRGPLQRLANELRLRNTRFAGQIGQEAMVQQYAKAAIYLNGSEIDNQPLSILEAFACGLPVVTTDAGGIPDVVANGETGFVVRRGDYEALAECALRLLQDSRLSRSICERAREECRKYSWKAVREQWLNLYYELANEEAEMPRRSGDAEVAQEKARRSEQNVVSR